MSSVYVYVVVGIFVDFDDTFAGSQLAVFAVRPSVVKVRVMDMAAGFASASPSASCCGTSQPGRTACAEHHWYRFEATSIAGIDYYYACARHR